MSIPKSLERLYCSHLIGHFLHAHISMWMKFLCMPISGYLKILLSIYLYYNFHGCPSQYAYICNSENAPQCMPMSDSQPMVPYICPYCGWKFSCLQMHKRGSQQCSSVYASIRVSKDAPLYMPIYDFSKIPTYICPYLIPSGQILSITISAL